MQIEKSNIDVFFDPSVVEEVRESIQALITKYGKFLPIWVCRLSIAYDTSSETIMPISIDLNGGSACIYVTSSWLAEPLDKREHIFLKKIAYLLIQPYSFVVEDVLDSLIENSIISEEMVSFFSKQLQGGEENAVCEIVRAFNKASKA